MEAGFTVTITSRTPAPEPGLNIIPFDAAAPRHRRPPHISSPPPPRTSRATRSCAATVLQSRAAKNLTLYRLPLHHRRLWQPGGAWVDEDTAACAAIRPRALRRVEAEAAWSAFPSPSISSASPAFTALAARCSTICAPAPRGASSNPAISSAASIGTTSPMACSPPCSATPSPASASSIFPMMNRQPARM